MRPTIAPRLAIGTVQFGVPYGISNSGAKVAVAEVESILQNAREAGVDTLDTAIAYGDSEAVLGAVDVSAWKVITKLPALPMNVVDVFGWVRSQVDASLARLRIHCLDGLLLHRPSDLTGPYGSSYISALMKIRDSGLTHALGVSIYSPTELDSLLPRFKPEIVQAPCNVLDRRLISSGWITKLEEQGIRLHLRSAFLQGLLLMGAERRPAYFSSKTALLDRWLDWCRSEHVSPLAAAISFVCALNGVDRVVVGVDSLSHLNEILEATRSGVPLPPADLFSDDLDLIDPSRWKLT